MLDPSSRHDVGGGWWDGRAVLASNLNRCNEIILTRFFVVVSSPASNVLFFGVLIEGGNKIDSGCLGEGDGLLFRSKASLLLRKSAAGFVVDGVDSLASVARG